jgi:cytochrome c oxidase subunit III
MSTSETAVATEPHSHEGDDHHAHPDFLQHHFDTPEQQFDAAKLGMWVFICTEILMFGGLFVAYGIFRAQEPQIFFKAHEHLDRVMGAINTVVLLFSSLTAALAVRSSQLGKRGQTSLYLVITLLCAGVFLVVKYFEYSHKIHDGLLPGRCFGHPGFGDKCLESSWGTVNPLPVHGLPPRASMFFALYFMMTGLHGIHVVVGMSILGWVLYKNMQGKITSEYFTPVDIGALYWHLVDLVWIYLFPLLYLVG